MKTTKNTSYEVRPDRHSTQAISELHPEEGVIIYDEVEKVHKTWKDGELESLGSSSVSEHIGLVDYNDTSTAATPIQLVADTWTDVPNNAAGAFTLESYLPDGMTTLIDPVTGYLDFSELTFGSDILIRFDGEYTPNINNALFEARYVLGQGGGEYPLDSFSKRCDSGSGIPYSTEKGTFYIYMGDENTKGGVGKIQVKGSSAGTFKNNGVAIKIYKR